MLWPERGGWRLGEGIQSSVQASSSRSPRRNASIVLGVSRPRGELPLPTPSPPRSRRAAPRQAPGQPSPAALTCEPRPGPSIAPATVGTPRSGGCNPLASAPRASRIPLPARGPASAAAPAHACPRQSASGKPIPALLSPGGGTFLPPGRRVGNRELEAPPPVRGEVPAPGQDHIRNLNPSSRTA